MNSFKILVVILIMSSWIGFGLYIRNQRSKPQNDSSIPKVTTINVQRFGMVTGLKPEKMAHYKKLHADAGSGVLKKIAEFNIHNYSIYIQKIENKYFLFSYFEYSGVDLEKDMAKMAADTATRRWWKETDPTQNPLLEAVAQKNQWQNMEEVLHTD